METKFPNKLKLFRHALGYSQKRVAALMKLSDTSTLSRWEHGCSLPSILQVFHLSRIYQTQPHHLFSDLWEQIITEKSLEAHSDEHFII